MANPDVLSQPQYEPVFEQNIGMPMRDGTILRANVTRPNADPVGALALQLRTGDRRSRLEARILCPAGLRHRG